MVLTTWICRFPRLTCFQFDCFSTPRQWDKNSYKRALDIHFLCLRWSLLSFDSFGFSFCLNLGWRWGPQWAPEKVNNIEERPNKKGFKRHLLVALLEMTPGARLVPTLLAFAKAADRLDWFVVAGCWTLAMASVNAENFVELKAN